MATELDLILGAAESALGVQYLWGGNSLATGVDCSGLVQQAFLAAGYKMPRVSNQQAKMGEEVTGDYQPGDLLFWDNSSRNVGADHVAIYIGNGLVLEAYKTGEPVRVAALEGGRRKPPTSVRRVIGTEPAYKGVLPRPTLGPNQDRRYTTAALNPTSGAPGPTVFPQSATAAPPSGGLGDDLPPNATDEQVEAYIREHYADVAPFLVNDEIRNLAFRAAREGFSGATLTHEFRQTDYFKTHGEASRAFDAFLGADPDEAGRLVDKVKGVVGDVLTKNGVEADDTQVGIVAKQAIRNGWVNLDGQILDQKAIDDFVVFAAGAKGGGLTGELGFSADQLMATAKQYLVPITRQDAEQWALQLKSGAQTEESYVSWLTSLAKARYSTQPDILAALDQGLTPSQFFVGAKNTAAQILELDPNTIDLMDHRWSWMVETVDEKGNRRAPTLGEVATMARQRPEFAKTRQYKETTAEYTLGLSKFFGRAA